MAVDIISELVKWNFSKLHAWVDFKSDSYLQQNEGGDPFFLLQKGDNADFTVNAGGVIYFYLPDSSVVKFVISDNPDDSGEEFKSNSLANDNAFYLSAVADLNGNFELTKHYVFSYSDPAEGIRVEPRDLSFGVFDTDTEKGVTTKFKKDTTNFLDPQYNNNISLRVRTYLEQERGTDVFTLVGEDALSFNAEGIASFNAAPVLDAYLELDSAEVAENTAVTVDSVLKRWRVDYCEFDVSTNDFNKVKTGPISFIHKGGPNAETEGVFYQLLTLGKSVFLSNFPKERHVVKDQDAWVSVLVDDLTAGIDKFKVTVFKTDGTQQDVEQDFTEFTKDSTIRIPIGYNQLGLDSTLVATQQVTHYIVEIKNGTTVLASITMVMADYSYQDKFWMFTNSFGVVEVFRARQRFETIIKTDKGKFVASNNSKNTAKRQVESYGNNYTLALKAGAGMVCEKEALALIDLMTKRQVFLIENGQKIPYFIPPSKMGLGMDDEGELILSFSAERAFSETQIFVP